MIQKKINIVLAGHANVGKTVIFNNLTGLRQHVGNWPGKTVSKAEGTFCYHGFTIDVLDLPGIYSFSTYSLEEIISRDYIVYNNPDFVVNVVDATNIERNLIFTLQLLELQKPIVIALNMVNLLKEKGIVINFKQLSMLLSVPVVQVAAIYGKGLTDIIDQGISLTSLNQIIQAPKYGKEVENSIEQLSNSINIQDLSYPKRFLAIKLLEKDEEIITFVKNKQPEILLLSKDLSFELEKIHGHDSSIVISDERCNFASKIIKQVVSITKPQKISANELLDKLTGHGFFGYIAMAIIFGAFFLTVFGFGNYISSNLENLLIHWQAGFRNIFGYSAISSLLWSGISSILALFEIAVPYVFPFYFVLFLLESWGYLARVSYLMDHLMHKIGVHGKACIPLMLGLGCTATACLACRIMETKREKLITGILTTFVPCGAVTIIILGLTGKYLGMKWAILLYLFILLTIIFIGKLASKIAPGEITELIMEMPSYKKPNLKSILFQTLFELKHFIKIAGPIVIGLGFLIEAIKLLNWLPYVNSFLKPITVNWLGLPIVTGVLLIFGILRKELILIMLATLLGTTNFATQLTSLQIFTLSLVSVLYIPCVTTIAALSNEFGLKVAILIAMFKIAFAIIVSGIAIRIFYLYKIIALTL